MYKSFDSTIEKQKLLEHLVNVTDVIMAFNFTNLSRAEVYRLQGWVDLMADQMLRFHRDKVQKLENNPAHRL